MNLSDLPKTPRLPVLFLGHGSPMNAITDNPFRLAWRQLGTEFGARFPRPSAIVCISAHWVTRGWWVTGMDKPRTIHDFGGFPQALFDQQYPVPGAPALARTLARTASATGTPTPQAKSDGAPAVRIDASEWGLDHGSWSVLMPMFPAADIPVLQLSVNGEATAADHLAMGRWLRRLRDHGVLLVGSGNVVHNLRAVRRDAPDGMGYDWAQAFDAKVAELLALGDHDALAQFASWGPLTTQAHPTVEHFLPLLPMLGATQAKEALRSFNTQIQLGSIGMRSMVWG